jgi:hypothetical protein
MNCLQCYPGFSNGLVGECRTLTTTPDLLDSGIDSYPHGSFNFGYDIINGFNVQGARYNRDITGTLFFQYFTNAPNYGCYPQYIGGGQSNWLLGNSVQTVTNLY